MAELPETNNKDRAMNPPFRFTTLAALATCLTLAAATAMAQTQPDRSWTGSALLYTPSSVAGCNVAVMEAATRTGHIVVTLRQGGPATLNITLSGELAGNGLRSIATVTAMLPPGRNVQLTMMRPYAGSLGGSVLTLRASACSVLS